MDDKKLERANELKDSIVKVTGYIRELDNLFGEAPRYVGMTLHTGEIAPFKDELMALLCDYRIKIENEYKNI